MKTRAITVFGSGSTAEGSKGWKKAYELGALLANEGFTVVNGGYNGTMLATAKGAKEAGGKTIGVTTDEFQESIKNPFIDREIRKASWRERLHELIRLGDGYIVLDGGTGTLTELMVVWEMANKGLHTKPIAILGKRLQATVNSLKRNPEVQVPKAFEFVPDAKAAVRFFKEVFIDG